MNWIYSGLLLIAVILIFVAFKQYTITKSLLSNGIKTNGKVIDLLRSSSSDGDTFKPVFEFTDIENNVVTFESSVSSRPAPYDIGDKVEIVYEMDSDVRKVISFWGLYRWTIIPLMIAMPLFIVGFGYILYSRAY